MTKRVFRGWVAGFCVTLVSGLMAQEATPEFDPLGETVEAPRLVRVQVEFIEMAHESLTKLLLEPRKGANDADLVVRTDRRGGQ